MTWVVIGSVVIFLVAAAVGIYMNRARLFKQPAPRIEDTSCATFDKVNKATILNFLDYILFRGISKFGDLKNGPWS